MTLSSSESPTWKSLASRTPVLFFAVYNVCIYAELVVRMRMIIERARGQKRLISHLSGAAAAPS